MESICRFGAFVRAIYRLRRNAAGRAAKDSPNAAPAVPGAAPIVGGAAADADAGLKELDEADRKAAEKQKTCPVSGEKLGSMGKPYKVTHEGPHLLPLLRRVSGRVGRPRGQVPEEAEGLTAAEKQKGTADKRGQNRESRGLDTDETQIKTSSCFLSVFHFVFNLRPPFIPRTPAFTA